MFLYSLGIYMATDTKKMSIQLQDPSGFVPPEGVTMSDYMQLCRVRYI